MEKVRNEEEHRREERTKWSSIRQRCTRWIAQVMRHKKYNGRKH
jgi:hypothetical protein